MQLFDQKSQYRLIFQAIGFSCNMPEHNDVLNIYTDFYQRLQ